MNLIILEPKLKGVKINDKDLTSSHKCLRNGGRFLFLFFQQLNKCFVCYWEILSQFEMPYTVKWEF